MAWGLVLLFCFVGSLAAKDRVTKIENPVICADVPDMDCIRVGEDFYLMSTTMHLMPGAPMMRSRDLKNWEPVGYIFPSLHDKPSYDLLGGTVYGRGQWATSIRFHKGRFYALFSPNDEPFRSYIYSAERAEGSWTLVSRMKHFHDASLFFDDDDRVYVFSGTGELTELNKDLSGVKEGGVNMRLFERDSEETGLLEGSRVIKREGRYYLLMISWPSGKPRRQVCFRSDKITGPYEKKAILESQFQGYPYVGQGTVVDDGQGNWYGLIFQDRGAIGRVPLLMPCTWKDGWPILGDKDGKVPLTWQYPLEEEAAKPFVISDDFDKEDLDLHWQWNHNPVATAYSLQARHGFLRLSTSRVVDNLYLAPNTLTQRMEGPACSGEVSLDVSHMLSGDVAGLAAFNGESAVLAVRCQGKRKFLEMTAQSVEFDKSGGKRIEAVDIKKQGSVDVTGRKTIRLRLTAVFQEGMRHADEASFQYSLDGKTWRDIGTKEKMRFDYRKFFMGTKFAIFSYATERLGGYVDVDYFHYERQK